MPSQFGLLRVARRVQRGARSSVRGSSGAGVLGDAFDVTHRESALGDASRGVEAQTVVGDGEQRAGVSERDRAVADESPDAIRQLQYAQEVGDGRAVLADGIGDLLLGERELVDEALVSERLVQGVEVGALEVLDQGEREHFAIVERLDDGRDLGPAEAGGGAKASLAGDEFEAACRNGADGDGLEEPAGADGVFEFGEFLRGGSRGEAGRDSP